MEMPKPGAEHSLLKAFEGKWTGEERIHPSPWDPEGGPATARWENRMDLDGFFVLCDYVQERGVQVSYRGHGAYGYDGMAGTFQKHHTFTFSGESFTMRIDHSQDGSEWAPFVEGTYTRS